jgi:hypothetical protein
VLEDRSNSFVWLFAREPLYAGGIRSSNRSL